MFLLQLCVIVHINTVWESLTIKVYHVPTWEINIAYYLVSIFSDNFSFIIVFTEHFAYVTSSRFAIDI